MKSISETMGVGELREKVARIIDPMAFKGHAGMVAYCLKTGETPENAQRWADDSYDLKTPLSKADQIIALLPTGVDRGGSAQSQPCDRRADALSVGLDAEPSAAEKPEPNPEWEAKADAAHAAMGESNPFDTLTMLETWKAHAEPADCDGRISFSRALLDSAQDALKAALEMARSEHLRGKMAFVRGAQECREMLARFVEQGAPGTRGGAHVLIAQSIRANWNPEWGADPGPPRNMRDHGWLGPALHDKMVALSASPAGPRSLSVSQDEPVTDPLRATTESGETRLVLAEKVVEAGKPFAKALRLSTVHDADENLTRHSLSVFLKPDDFRALSAALTAYETAFPKPLSPILVEGGDRSSRADPSPLDASRHSSNANAEPSGKESA